MGLFDEIVQYLSSRPYKEVAVLLDKLGGEVRPQVSPKVPDADRK